MTYKISCEDRLKAELQRRRLGVNTMSIRLAADGMIQAPLLVPSEPAFLPTSKTERIVSIDFLRGMALLGILLVNCAALFGPIGTLSDATLLRQMADRDQIAYLVVLSVCQGKFISIFSRLFGYGLLRQFEKATSAGRSSPLFVVRRLGMRLLVFGFLHAVLICVRRHPVPASIR